MIPVAVPNCRDTTRGGPNPAWAQGCRAPDVGRGEGQAPDVGLGEGRAPGRGLGRGLGSARLANVDLLTVLGPLKRGAWGPAGNRLAARLTTACGPRRAGSWR